MEQLLLKMAKQLDSLDEASLENLWEKYAQIVNNFEPTTRWEEAVLVLSFIQAKSWKNHLFNTQWAMRSKLSALIDIDETGTNLKFDGMVKGINKETKPQKKATVLQFDPKG